MLLLVNQAHAQIEKNVTLTIGQGELVYCYGGNPKKPTVVCDSMQLQDSFTLIDNFLELMEYGPTVGHH